MDPAVGRVRAGWQGANPSEGLAIARIRNAAGTGQRGRAHQAHDRPSRQTLELRRSALIYAVMRHVPATERPVIRRPCMAAQARVRTRGQP